MSTRTECKIGSYSTIVAFRTSALPRWQKSSSKRSSTLIIRSSKRDRKRSRSTTIKTSTASHPTLIRYLGIPSFRKRPSRSSTRLRSFRNPCLSPEILFKATTLSKLAKRGCQARTRRALENLWLQRVGSIWEFSEISMSLCLLRLSPPILRLSPPMIKTT